MTFEEKFPSSKNWPMHWEDDATLFIERDCLDKQRVREAIESAHKKHVKHIKRWPDDDTGEKHQDFLWEELGLD